VTDREPAAATDPAPTWRTGPLWGVLAVLLVFGAVGLAGAAYGVLDLIGGALVVGAVASAAGAAVALFAFLLTIGILYRVDRYRGTLGRKVELFE
jgi:hypothetical protein